MGCGASYKLLMNIQPDGWTCEGVFGADDMIIQLRGNASATLSLRIAQGSSRSSIACGKAVPSNPGLACCYGWGSPQLQSMPNSMSSGFIVSSQHETSARLNIGLLANEPFSSTAVFAASANARNSCSSRVAVSKNLASSLDTDKHIIQVSRVK